MEQDKGQKGIAQILLIIIILVGIAVGVYLVQQNTDFFSDASSKKKEVSQFKKNIPGQEAKKGKASQEEIKSGNDLKNVLGDLDNTDLNALDKELSQNDSDASGF